MSEKVVSNAENTENIFNELLELYENFIITDGDKDGFIDDFAEKLKKLDTSGLINLFLDNWFFNKVSQGSDILIVWDTVPSLLNKAEKKTWWFIKWLKNLLTTEGREINKIKGLSGKLKELKKARWEEAIHHIKKKDSITLLNLLNPDWLIPATEQNYLIYNGLKDIDSILKRLDDN